MLPAFAQPAVQQHTCASNGKGERQKQQCNQAERPFNFPAGLINFFRRDLYQHSPAQRRKWATARQQMLSVLPEECSTTVHGHHLLYILIVAYIPGPVGVADIW